MPDTLLSIAIVPLTGTIPVGQFISLAAIGTYTDGDYDVTSMCTWSTSNPANASVSLGLVAGLVAGNTTITATLLAFSASAGINVIPSEPENNFRKVLRLLCKPWQDIEDAIQQLRTLRSLNTAVGAQLDQIGARVGQARQGQDDTTYRQYCRARIAVNKAGGSVEDIIAVAVLILNDPSAYVHVKQEGEAAVAVQIENITVTDVVANVLIDLLQAVVVGGVRPIVETQYTADNRTLHTAISTTCDGASTAGATTLTVMDTSAFPGAGSLDIDIGLSVHEVITYTGVTDTSFTGIPVSGTGSMAYAHVDRSAVQLSRGVGRGLGTGCSVGPGTLGDVVLDADNTAGFPTAGTLMLSDGTLIAYTGLGTSPTRFTGLTLAANVAANTLAHLQDDGGYMPSARDTEYTL